MIRKIINKLGYDVVSLENSPIPNQIKIDEAYVKYKPFTMIPSYIFKLNLQLCDKFKDVEGSIVECGVWKGGMIAGVSEFLNQDRHYYLFDSFEGLPDVKEVDGIAAKKWQEDTASPYYFDNCSADQKFAEEAMQLAGAEKFSIIKGWFEDTLSSNKPNKIAILRLDGDWYSSTMTCLTNLYDQVTKGGIIILDDYYAWEGCSKAVHDFFSERELSVRIHQFKDNICYIVKE